MIATSLAGLLTGLSIIVAIGAQNAYVLRQGILRSHVAAVVLVCALSDVVLIAVGVSGVGVVVDRAEWVLTAIRWLGVAFLAWYGVSSLLRAWHPDTLAAASGGTAAPRSRVVGRAIALTWLNPHVYLDIIVYGILASAHGSGGRWWFAVGLAAASWLWFCGLGLGARMLAPVLARPRAWQIVDVLVALTMLLVAAKLAIG